MSGMLVISGISALIAVVVGPVALLGLQPAVGGPIVLLASALFFAAFVTSAHFLGAALMGVDAVDKYL
jgi:ABC-type Mn2+/Zn2+ transport system permease subunit